MYVHPSLHLFSIPRCSIHLNHIKLICTPNTQNTFVVYAASSRNNLPKNLPKNLRSPRHAKLPHTPVNKSEPKQPIKDNESVWSPDELEAITALFERKMPQKKPLFNSQPKSRPLPLPLPYKTRLPSTPSPKHHIRVASRTTLASRASVTDQVRKNPEALIAIARDIAALASDNSNVSEVLDAWSNFLRKGSLSTTIRELGHMGCPDRALQTFLWAQKQGPLLFPDDRILASTVEVLARYGKLKMEFELEKFLNSASRNVLEAMAKGFVKAGNLSRARKILLFARKNNRTLDSSVYVKLILKAGKNPDGYRLCSALLDELSEMEELDLKPQECTAVMKICVKLGRFEAVESLFDWYKKSGKEMTVVLYTTVVHSRYCEKKYREGMALVWEMERENLLLDLPAYRVVIRLCVALKDVDRCGRYFSRLKEAGFAPTYDIYRDMIRVYVACERLEKCMQTCKEVEMSGLQLDKDIFALLSQVKGKT